MRTTVTLDPDLVQQIRALMHERGTSFKDTINELLRRGLRTAGAPEPYLGPTFASGVQPGIDLDRALRLAADLEDAETVRKFEMGK